MGALDQQIIAQLPVVVLFIVFSLKLNKDHQLILKARDEEMKMALLALTKSLDSMSSRIYALGLGFVALAGSKDPMQGAKAAQEAMERTVTQQMRAREHRTASYDE